MNFDCISMMIYNDLLGFNCFNNVVVVVLIRGILKV